MTPGTESGSDGKDSWVSLLKICVEFSQDNYQVNNTVVLGLICDMDMEIKQHMNTNIFSDLI